MKLVVLENEFPVFNPELRAVHPFKKIISRDKDRQKKQALRELAYIYFSADYASPIWNLEEKRRQTELLRMCELDEEYKPDALVQEGIDWYRELQKTPTIRSLEEMRESMHSTSEVIKRLRETLNELLENTKDADGIGVAVSLLKDINSISSDFPKLVDSLEKVELKVKREVEEATGKGKSQLGEFEMRSSVN